GLLLPGSQFQHGLELFFHHERIGFVANDLDLDLRVVSFRSEEGKHDVAVSDVENFGQPGDKIDIGVPPVETLNASRISYTHCTQPPVLYSGAKQPGKRNTAPQCGKQILR